MRPETNALYYGDCLDWMAQWDDQTVDLIYLDPPFNSQTNYNILFGQTVGGAQYRAFTDTWTWDDAAAARMNRYRAAIARPAHGVIVGLDSIVGPSGMLSYLTYMAERLELCHRLLKPTGSLYLHCDPTASHYLKLVLDALFGPRNFRGETHWYYYNKMHDYRKKLFAAATDTILFYVKDATTDFTFHQLTEPREKPVRQLKRKKVDGKMVNARDENGKLIYQVRTERTVDNVWRIPMLQPASRERLGYATQKPLALLERIITASSNPGDVVLDPFCGCGTTIEAAQRLDRQWIGIDISPFAIDVIREHRLKDLAIPAHGIPYDLAGAVKLAREEPFAFETWAVTRLTGFVPNTKQVADGGVDGRATVWEQPDGDLTKLALAQVKGGRFSLSALRDFRGVMERERAALGCFITLEPATTRAAREESAGMGAVRIDGIEYPRLQRWSIADYFEQRAPALPLMADPYTGKPMQLRLA